MPRDHQAARSMENSGGMTRNRATTCFDRNMTELGQKRRFEIGRTTSDLHPIIRHFQSPSACLKGANRRHPDVIQSPLQPARRPGPVRGDLYEESAAQLAANLLKGHCGRSTAADEAK